MTTAEDVLTLVRKVFGRQVNLPADQVDPDQPAIALDGIESLHLLRAVAEIEDTLGVAIPDEVLLDDLTLRKLAEVVAGLPRRTTIR